MPGFEWFGDEERAQLADVIGSGVLMRYGFDGARNGHWKSLELEQALAARMGSKHAHVCSSGTSAVLSALICAGIGAGDEVILPPFTFVADVEAVLYAGATPVFADIDTTLNLNPQAIRDKITPRSKAVLLVHMCGSMAAVDEIQRICCENNLLLIEDVAQAIGGSFKGKSLGTFGYAGCYSFDYVKMVTCGEGGGVITDDPAMFDRLQAFTDHGHDHKGADRGKDLHPHMGLNFRISELHAAVGIAQLAKLDAMIDRQRANADVISAAISDLPNVQMRSIPDPAGDTCAFLSFLLPDGDATRRAAKALAAAGVDGCFHWFDNNWHYHRQWQHFKSFSSINRIHLANQQPAPAFTTEELPVSDAIMERTLSMLIKLSWTEEDTARRAESMRHTLVSL